MLVKPPPKQATKLKTSGQQPTPQEPMQIDTPEGPELNTGGTLQGEAGNRKQQKLPGKYFGLLRVSSNMYSNKQYCQTYICCYEDPTTAALLMDLLDVTWNNIDYTNFKYKEQYYVVIFELKFRIKYSTLKQRLGDTLTKTKYLTVRNMTQRINDTDDYKDHIIKMLDVLFLAKIPSIDIEDEISKELERSQYSNTSTSEPARKRQKW